MGRVLNKIYYTIIFIVVILMSPIGCSIYSQHESDLREYQIHYDMTEDFIIICDNSTKNKDTSVYWACMETAHMVGLGADDAQVVMKRIGIRSTNNIIAIIRLRKSIWTAFEDGELPYEIAKLKDSVADSSMHYQ